MAVDVILGLQWGDEGKGKIVDLMSANYDIIARFQGGPNAGHTIIIGDKKFVLHQIPSGVIRPDVINVIGNAVVLDPVILLKEIEQLENHGIDVRSRLLVSRRANLILPTHRMIDACQEKSTSAGKVGSTLKGIGPTYQDKTGRFGLRLGEIHSPDFKGRYERATERHLSILRAMGCSEEVDDAAWWKALDAISSLQLIDAEVYLNDAIKDGKRILAEGAQGSLLDIDFGSYPYVTSSNTLLPGVCTGLGISHKQIGKVYGIFKAYSTRVGEGPFPTELNDADGQMLRDKGHEYGSTTGRPRRTGWLDLVALEYACMLNGVDELIMMKMDVMNELEQVRVATSYTVGGFETGFSALAFESTEEVIPHYDSLEGWNGDIQEVKSYEALPEQAQSYIRYIEGKTGLPIRIISVGPERDQTIMV